jgi:hypothetical protein
MSQPTPYARVNDFTTYARNNSAAPYNAAMLDAEFNAVSVSLNATITNIGLIQRDDGQLKNTVVTPDALNNATLNLIGDWTPKGPWLPSQTYAVRDMVTVDLVVSYVCAVAHLSSSFAVDLAAGYWQQVNGTDALVANITFTQSDVVLGRVTSGGGPGEEIPCTSFARTLLDDASAAAALTTLGLGTGSNPTFNNLTVAGLVITGGIGSTFLYVDAGHGVTTAAPAPQNGQLLIGRTGLDPIVANITGISDQVNVTNGAGSITLSLPQSIAPTSTPTFATVNLTNLAVGSVVFVGNSSALTQDTKFFYDTANNFLGINIATPTAVLTLGDFLVGSTPAIDFHESGDIQTILATSGEFSFSTDASAPGSILDMSVSQFIIGAPQLVLGGNAAACFINVDAADVLALRDGADAQKLRGYRTYTDAANYERWALQSGAGYFELAAESAGTGTANIDVRLTPKGAGLVTLPSLTMSGNLVVNGNTTLGDAAGDALTVAPNAVTWSNNPTHSGNHTFSGTVNVTGKVDSASYVENGAGATQFSKTNGALAANADLDCTTAASGLLIIRNNSDGGVAIVSVDIGTGTCTEISDPSAYVTVGADPGAASSQFWVTTTGGTTIRLRNRYAAAKNVSVGYSLLGGTPA